MSTTFRPYAPDQSLLLPPDVREWLPEGHLAHHVSDLVDDLDLTAFYVPYEGDGRRNAPHEPRMYGEPDERAQSGIVAAWTGGRGASRSTWTRRTTRRTGRSARLRTFKGPPTGSLPAIRDRIRFRS